MEKVKYLGKCTIDNEEMNIFLLDNEKLVYISEDGKEAFLDKIGSEEEDFDFVSFNDPVLESAIREEIDKSCGSLTIGDLKKIDTLDVSTFKIQDFTGIEKLKELKVFKAWMVPAISKSIHLLKEMKNLEYIDIGSCNLNYLKSDTFEGLTNLKEIAIDGNLVYELPDNIFETNTNLKWLHVDNTGLANLDFLSGLENLEGLYAEDNRINNLIGLKHTPNLKILRLSNNSIRKVDCIGDLTKLERLHVDDNKISDISPLDSLVQLKRLRAQGNMITDICSLKNLDKLEILYLDDNNIQDISCLRYKRNLQQLQIRNNRIKTVEPLNKLTNLRVLHIEGNKVNDVSHLDGIYDGLTNKDF